MQKNVILLKFLIFGACVLLIMIGLLLYRISIYEQQLVQFQLEIIELKELLEVILRSQQTEVVARSEGDWSSQNLILGILFFTVVGVVLYVSFFNNGSTSGADSPCCSPEDLAILRSIHHYPSPEASLYRLNDEFTLINKIERNQVVLTNDFYRMEEHLDSLLMKLNQISAAVVDSTASSFLASIFSSSL